MYKLTTIGFDLTVTELALTISFITISVKYKILHISSISPYTSTTPFTTKLFNHKKVLQNLNSDDFKSKPPDCTCTSSPFIYNLSDHVNITGGLNSISDTSLRRIERCVRQMAVISNSSRSGPKLKVDSTPFEIKYFWFEIIKLKIKEHKIKNKKTPSEICFYN
jgi:hypothetical protein